MFGQLLQHGGVEAAQAAVVGYILLVKASRSDLSCNGRSRGKAMRLRRKDVRLAIPPLGPGRYQVNWLA